MEQAATAAGRDMDRTRGSAMRVNGRLWLQTGGPLLFAMALPLLVAMWWQQRDKDYSAREWVSLQPRNKDFYLCDKQQPGTVVGNRLALPRESQAPAGEFALGPADLDLLAVVATLTDRMGVYAQRALRAPDAQLPRASQPLTRIRQTCSTDPGDPPVDDKRAVFPLVASAAPGLKTLPTTPPLPVVALRDGPLLFMRVQARLADGRRLALHGSADTGQSATDEALVTRAEAFIYDTAGHTLQVSMTLLREYAPCRRENRGTTCSRFSLHARGKNGEYVVFGDKGGTAQRQLKVYRTDFRTINRRTLDAAESSRFIAH